MQDDWKVSRRLTLNLGMRWDYQQKPYERNNGQINFDPNALIPITGRAGVTRSSRASNGAPARSWTKTITISGLASVSPLDVFGTGKTVLRGGYGIFYPAIFFRNFLGNTTLFSTTRTSYVAQGPGLTAFQFAKGFPYAPVESPGASAGPSALLGQR